jgi:uroporphyrinogen-III synthase
MTDGRSGTARDVAKSSAGSIPGSGTAARSAGIPSGSNGSIPAASTAAGAARGPLAGKQIVVTQATHQAPELAGLLAGAGAQPLLYPCIAIAPPADPVELDGALATLAAGGYDWLVITSANTVLALAARLHHLGVPPGALQGVRVAAIGTASDDALAEHLGRRADLVPDDSKAEGLAAALCAVVRPPQRVLLPQADLARPVLAEALAAAGLAVTPIVAYHTTLGGGGVDLPALLARAGAVDAIAFTSPSTVRNLLARLTQEGGDRRYLQRVLLACIGPVTADALHAAGLPPAVAATNQSLEGLVAALIAYYRNKP